MAINSSITTVVFKGNIVTLRAREGAKGKSLYLDYIVNKQRRYEFLKGLELKKTNNKQKNKENKEVAISICQKRDLSLQAGEYDFIPAFTSNTDFVAYFEAFNKEYQRKDKRMFEASFNQFKQFLDSEQITRLQAKQITDKLVRKFADYLQNNKSLKGETPHSYFKRFKKFLRQASKEKIIKSDFGRDVSIKVNDSVTKDILSIAEITLLAHNNCSDDRVKRAFIFSCVTGLRYVDVVKITWGNVDGNILKFLQEKTGREQIIMLNQTALQLAGMKQGNEDKIFNLPSFHTCLKVLKDWGARAEIDKHITWHVSRHSFATNLLINDTDVKTTAGLLGHSGLKHVDRYVRLVKSLQEKAVTKLEINL